MSIEDGMTGGAGSELLRVLGEELQARVRERGPSSALRTMRADVGDGLVPGATVVDLALVARAHGLLSACRRKHSGPPTSAEAVLAAIKDHRGQ